MGTTVFAAVYVRNQGARRHPGGPAVDRMSTHDAADTVRRRMSHLVRLAKFLVPVIIAVETVLVLSGVTSIGDATMVVIATEVLLFWLIVIEIVEIRRAYRRFAREEPDRFTAAMRAVESVLPEPVGRLLAHELMLQRALVLLRKRDVPPGGRGIPHHRPVMGFLGAVLGLTAVEMLVVELAVPWPTVRWLLLAVSLIGCWWLAGFAAGLVVHPVTVGPDTLRIRYSCFADLSVPLAAIDRVVPLPRSRGRRRTAMAHGDEPVVEVGGAATRCSTCGSPCRYASGAVRPVRSAASTRGWTIPRRSPPPWRSTGEVRGQRGGGSPPVGGETPRYAPVCRDPPAPGRDPVTAAPWRRSSPPRAPRRAPGPSSSGAPRPARSP